MKPRSQHSTYAVARAAASALLFAVIAFGPGAASAAKGSGEAGAETHIAEMHAKLKITPAQEEQWAKVAEVMRENAKSMAVLARNRSEQARTMNAVEDLKSYGDITEAHADAIKRLTPVFAALYAVMSDAQKKEADAIFRHAGRKAQKRK
jgi:Spy/CpxP family protein refolding chaperone